MWNSLEKNKKIVLEMAQISSDEATGTKALQCLLPEMVEYSALIDMYRAKLRDMHSQLKGREIVIGELKALIEQNSIRIFIVMVHPYGTREDTKVWAKIIFAHAKKYSRIEVSLTEGRWVRQKGNSEQTSQGMNA